MIRIYAKTTKRIRFEVVYDRDLLRQRAATSSQEVPIDEAAEALDRIASSAATDLETVFRTIARSAQPVNSRGIIDLVERVYDRSPSTDIASNILRMLASRGCIFMVPNTQFGQVITRLRRDGVLGQPLRCGARTTYPVSAEYRDAAHRLT